MSFTCFYILYARYGAQVQIRRIRGRKLQNGRKTSKVGEVDQVLRHEATGEKREATTLFRFDQVCIELWCWNDGVLK